MTDELFIADAAQIARFGGDTLFSHLDWTIRAGECWAIVGPIASGKTLLTETILGRHRIVSGSLRWPFIDSLRAVGRTVEWPADVIRRVSFKEESRLFSYSQHYYQQRFNFIEADDDLSLRDYLRSGLGVNDAEVERIIKPLDILDLQDRSIIHLSNGQMRRARLARALLAKPEWLLLDEPFMGLDQAGRAELVTLIGELLHQGIHLTLVTRPDHLPEWVTHVLELDAMRIVQQVPRSEYQPRSIARSTPAATITAEIGPPIVELQHVTVRYDGKAVLDDVSWTVRQGERWALLGPNGSGKTTLLSLLAGDHPQAYCNIVRLFGRQRGTGETIWDIKKKVGLLSPEFHLYFSEPLNAFDTAATGFHDVLVYRDITAEQEATLRELFAYFELQSLAEQRFARLSTGQQRLVLFIRALVKSPPLLILDEPFQGLDSPAIARAREWLDTRLRPDQTLIFVSHYAEEIPQSVTQIIRLERGRMENCGA